MCAYCFLVQNPARTCLLDTVRLLFLGKNPPRAIIKSRVFIKFGLFSQFFFGLFHQYFSNFSLFYANFIHFPHLVPLVDFGYTGKNYTVRLFHPVCLLKFWYFSTLCVYSIPCVYWNWRDLPPCAFIPDRAFIWECRVYTGYKIEILRKWAFFQK